MFIGYDGLSFFDDGFADEFGLREEEVHDLVDDFAVFIDFDAFVRHVVSVVALVALHEFVLGFISTALVELAGFGY